MICSIWPISSSFPKYYSNIYQMKMIFIKSKPPNGHSLQFGNTCGFLSSLVRTEHILDKSRKKKVLEPSHKWMPVVWKTSLLSSWDTSFLETMTHLAASHMFPSLKLSNIPGLTFFRLEIFLIINLRWSKCRILIPFSITHSIHTFFFPLIVLLTLVLLLQRPCLDTSYQMAAVWNV